MSPPWAMHLLPQTPYQSNFVMRVFPFLMLHFDYKTEPYTNTARTIGMIQIWARLFQTLDLQFLYSHYSCFIFASCPEALHTEMFSFSSATQSPDCQVHGVECLTLSITWASPSLSHTPDPSFLFPAIYTTWSDQVSLCACYLPTVTYHLTRLPFCLPICQPTCLSLHLTVSPAILFIWDFLHRTFVWGPSLHAQTPASWQQNPTSHGPSRCFFSNCMSCLITSSASKVVGIRPVVEGSAIGSSDCGTP